MCWRETVPRDGVAYILFVRTSKKGQIPRSPRRYFLGKVTIDNRRGTLEGMVPALDGVVGFNFASATAPKRSENAKRRCIQDREDVVVVFSFLFFYSFFL